jgi:arylsulfate sulfotransferase
MYKCAKRCRWPTPAPKKYAAQASLAESKSFKIQAMVHRAVRRSQRLFRSLVSLGRDFMEMSNKTLSFLIGLLTVLSVPAFATVTIVSMRPSHASPQPIGKSITWTATATDSSAGPLTFQFNITPPNGSLTMVKDFNVGTLSGGTWTAPSFVWVPTTIEGSYKVQVIAKDFVSGQSASKTFTFQVTALVTGSTPVVEKTFNPLVALFSAPFCAAGSTMRVAFQEQTGSTPVSVTNWVGCHPPASITFEVAGMYPSTAYNMYAQTNTGGKITDSPTISFTTGALPTSVPFPKFTANPVGTDTTYPVTLHNFSQLGTGGLYADVATDLKGNIIWYYYSNNATHTDRLTRPLPGGGMLTLQNDIAWDPHVPQGQLQFLRQIDLAGNLVRETNMGVIQQELLALGSVDGGPCTAIPSPPPVGAACTGAFHHDAIETLPGGYTAALIDIEKIFPPGTQGDTSGLPVDVIGDMIIVLNANWQVVWYWDAFDPANGGNGYSKLPVARTALLGETCGGGSVGCPPVLLRSPGNIAPLAHDWLHANSLYYWPAPQDGNTTGGDIVWSSRHQDSIIKIDYQDGAGTGTILWRMGPPDNLTPGDFIFNNTWNDPWEWFSHQHDVGIENGGAGPMTIMDNGNTRVSLPPLGLGTGCSPYDCDSRGMALTVDESSMTVTPVVSYDLGSYSPAMGSAQLLGDGNYFFENAIVFVQAQESTFGYSIEIFGTGPPAPQVGPAGFLMNLSGPQQYRGWQMPSLYNPPTT